MTDALVIGGGIIGCAIARALAVSGASVVLLDPRDIGDGASRASAGMLAPYTEGQHDAVLQALGARGLEAYDTLIASLRAEGLAVPFARDGSIEIACDDTAERMLDGMGAALASAGVANDRLSASQLLAAEPALRPDVRGGLRIPAHAAVDVPALVDALWQSAARRGACHLRRTAAAIRTGSAGAAVATGDGELAAQHVVLAAGCWASQIAIEHMSLLPVRPVRGQLLSLRLPRQVLRHALWGPGCYLVPWDDGRVLVGATVEEAGFDERATAGGVRTLLDAAASLIPALSAAEFTDVRVGLRPASSDGRPIVGRTRHVDGLILAAGHYRNGALLAAITAEAVLDIVNGTPLDEVWAPCSPDRFEPA